jgi:GAF domain-containing protein
VIGPLVDGLMTLRRWAIEDHRPIGVAWDEGAGMASPPTFEGQRPDPTLAFAGMAKFIFGGEPLDVIVGRIAELGRETMTEIDEVSVTFVEDDRAKTVAFTSPLAVSLDERQYEHGLGPCLDAAISGRTIVVDTATDSSYLEFSHAAYRAGIRHSVSVGLPIPQRIVGALNLYSSSPQPVGAQTVAMAEDFAGYAAVAIANAAVYDGATQLAAQMRTAMQSRAVIEQAKGILMGQRRLTADQAFQTLARISQTSNRKLRDVAQRMVDDAVGPEDPTG